jgi:hypothetical protein
MIWATVWITVLSLIAWVAYAQWFHATPTKEETMVLVGLCALAVFAGKALLGRAKGHRPGEESNR